MKFRRLKAGILTGVMCVALSVPAFAATDPLNPTLKVTSTTQLPTINMQLPTNPAVVLNPYKLQVTLGKDKITDQIANPLMSVVNLSDCPIQVGAQVSATVAGNATLATASAKDNATANGVFINIAAKVGTASDARTTLVKADGTAETGVTSVNLTATAADLHADFKGDGSSTAKLVNTLKAAVNGKAAADSSALNFTFYGDASSKGPWTAKDTVTPSITFKFIPLADMPTT